MSYRRYARYKDSGAPWIGDVPAHWNVVQLRRAIRRIEQGWSPECDNRPAEGAEWGVLKAGCVNGGVFNATENKALPSHLEPPEHLEVRDGDLLMSRASGSPELVGSAAFVSNAPARLLLSDKIFRLHLDKHINPKFLAWLLGSRSMRGQIEQAISGAEGLANNLPQSALLEFVAALPPRSEQDDICNRLEVDVAKLDHLIDEQQRLIDLLGERRRAIAAHAVTAGHGQSTPTTFADTAPLSCTPALWRVVRLKFLARVQTGLAKGKDNSGEPTVEVPYLRVANVQDGHIDLSDVAVMEVPAKELDRYLLRVGDVLMNEGGDYDKLGRGHVWDGSIDPCIHQNHVFAVRPFGVSPEWLNLVTGSAYAQFHFMSRSKQSTNLASISSTNIMELPVVVPPPDEQRTILDWVQRETAAIDRLASDATTAVSLLRERRAALVSAAVTGKIDVRTSALTELA